MEIECFPEEFTICQVPDYSLVRMNSDFFWIGKTNQECSLVCLSSDVPADVLKKEEGWRGFCLRGPLDFSLIGILAGISALLAQEHIALFVVSTFDTDCFFVKKEQFEPALSVLEQHGYKIFSPATHANPL